MVTLAVYSLLGTNIFAHLNLLPTPDLNLLPTPGLSLTLNINYLSSDSSSRFICKHVLLQNTFLQNFNTHVQMLITILIKAICHYSIMM